MLRPEFVRHASVEAIQAEIGLCTKVIEREGERLGALQRLRSERLEQLADKTWPGSASAAADEPCECGQTTHANCPRDNECRAEIERQASLAAADEPKGQP